MKIAAHTNFPWLEDRTILYVRHGSNAYGTNTATSDEDFKGVAVAPKEFYLGVTLKWEQAESKTPDSVIYDIRKYLALAADCNPNIIELMWTDASDVRIMTEAGEKLIANRKLFLSRRARHTFCGYAVSQLKRIKTHRRWLLNPPTHKPTRGEFSLPERTIVPADQLAAAEAAIRKELDSWELDLSGLDDARRLEIQTQFEVLAAKMGLGEQEKFQRATFLLNFSDNMIEVLDRERKYTAALREWQNYEKWKTERNSARAELEAKFGYDTKHAYHLVRLMRMCREILTEGIVKVRRPDAEELKAIRRGEMPYDQLIEWADQQDTEMQTIAEKSPLPKTPNTKAIDKLSIEIIESML